MINKILHDFIIPDTFAGKRLDQTLATLLPDYSRTQIKSWLESGEITINSNMVKPKWIVTGGESVVVEARLKQQPIFEAEAIPLSIVFEDESLLIINKPAGMVVHPAAGNMKSTLLNALLHHAPSLSELPRAGIIHRLDKETTGLLVIAKTAPALKNLTRQLKARTMHRIYKAIILGTPVSGGTVDAPIERHPIARKKMAVSETGKQAVTHYRIIEHYRAYTQVKVQLETGRTHQIRVHMAHINHSLLGDPVYGRRLQLPKGASPDLIQTLRTFKRQALHAFELSFEHPVSKKRVTFQASLPEDMRKLIKILKDDMVWK